MIRSSGSRLARRGIIKAIEMCFPKTERQRCLAHRMRNLTAEVQEDLWPEFNTRVTACEQAPSRAIARDLAEGVVAGFETKLPNAIASFTDDFEACITRLRMNISHRRCRLVTALGERIPLQLLPYCSRIPTHQAGNFALRFTAIMKPVNLNSVVKYELIILLSDSKTRSYRRCTWFENFAPGR